MPLPDITLAAFALCNSLRIFAYIPQIWKAASDKHGASAISCATWSLFLLAHVSTVAYAIVNRSDWGLAACFALNAMCCVAILAVTYRRRRQHTKGKRMPERRATSQPAWFESQPLPGVAAFFRWD